MAKLNDIRALAESHAAGMTTFAERAADLKAEREMKTGTYNYFTPPAPELKGPPSIDSFVRITSAMLTSGETTRYLRMHIKELKRGFDSAYPSISIYVDDKKICEVCGRQYSIREDEIRYNKKTHYRSCYYGDGLADRNICLDCREEATRRCVQEMVERARQNGII